MPSCSAIINVQHKGSSRRWGQGKQCLNHFAFSLAELLLMRGRQSWEPFVQSLACVSYCSGGRPHVIPTSPPPRHPGTQQGCNLGCLAQKTQGDLSLSSHRGKLGFSYGKSSRGVAIPLAWLCFPLGWGMEGEGWWLWWHRSEATQLHLGKRFQRGNRNRTTCWSAAPVSPRGNLAGLGWAFCFGAVCSAGANK